LKKARPPSRRMWRARARWRRRLGASGMTLRTEIEVRTSAPPRRAVLAAAVVGGAAAERVEDGDGADGPVGLEPGLDVVGAPAPRVDEEGGGGEREVGDAGTPSVFATGGPRRARGARRASGRR